jgi:hypothetical protein
MEGHERYRWMMMAANSEMRMRLEHEECLRHSALEAHRHLEIAIDNAEPRPAGSEAEAIAASWLVIEPEPTKSWEPDPDCE